MSNQSSVPKFASFRPKAKSEDASHTDAGRASHEGPGPSREPGREPSAVAKTRAFVEVDGDDISAGPETKRPRSRRNDHHAKSRVAGNRKALKSKSPERPLDQLDTDERIYQVDTKGDPHNLVYGTIHRYSIPGYYRWGAGTVVGLSHRFKIERNNAEEKVVIVDRSASQVKRREKYSFARNERRPIRKLRIREEAAPSTIEATKEFIPLKDSHASKAGDGQEALLGISEAEFDRDYRSIEGKAKAQAHPADRDLEYATDTSVSDYEALDVDASDASIRARGVELSEVVDKDPSSISHWLDLIHHQDAILDHRHGAGGRHPTEAERRSTADVKLSMYEKALTKVSKSVDGYEKLLFGLLETGSRIWDFKIQIRRWQAALEDNPSSVGLWTRYLDFHQTIFTAFTIDTLRNIYVECMRVLRATLCRPNTSVHECHDIERISIYVVLRFTILMREAGYTESAIAIWQGLLELNFFAPRNASSPAMNADDVLSTFEAFWDSEVARIGEPSAKGWAAYAAEDAPREIPEEKASSFDAHRDTGDIFQNWLELERQHTLASRGLARTTDDLPDDDPYRVVFYSDIKDFLVLISSEKARQALILGFLAFSRLPPLPLLDLDRKSYSWWTDAFIRTEVLDQADVFLSGMLGGESEEDSLSMRRGPFDFSFRNFVVSTETLFAQQGTWFSCVDAWTTRYSDGEGPIEISWLRRVLRSLITARAGDSVLAELYLAFEWINYPESARKSAKSILKEFPSSPRLYNAYALIEWRLGNAGTAENVFSTALNMSNTLSPNERDDDILLWKSWTWEILQVDANRALRAILSIPDGKTSGASSTVPIGSSDGVSNVHPTELLKARKFLELNLESAISSGKSARIMHLTDLLSLLIYLFQDRDIEQALSIYKKTLSSLSNRSSTNTNDTTIELLHQAKAHLLHHHATTSPHFRPALLRAEFAESIELFPQNTIFLSLYAWNERRFRIDDRVRSLMRDVVLNKREETVVGWVFAVCNEFRGSLGAGHNVNSTRAVFERAVDGGSSSCSSASIWTLYLLFTLRSQSIQTLSKAPPTASKNNRKKELLSIFHHAIRSCPWAKNLYLFAFRYMRDLMDHDELMGVYEVMREKELRVAVDLEGLVEGSLEG